MKEEKNIWFPYIKPTKRRHSSGYRIFEVGYVNQKDETVIISLNTDHISLSKITKGNIDLLDNGCIRFHEMETELRWWGDIGTSSVWLENGKPDYKKLDKLNESIT